MGGRKMHALVGLTALAACVLMMNVGTGAQATIEAPGARRPLAPSKPRITPLPEAEWTEVQRGLAAKYGANGRADNALRTLLHSPDLVDGVMPYTNYLSDESTLSPRHRELLILRVAWLCANPSIWATHAARARSAGFTAAEIRRIAQGPDASGWDPFEATLLRLADQLFRNSAVNEATWRALSANYDMFHQIDAVETAGHFIMLAMMYNSFGVQPDEGTVDRLPTDVPYPGRRAASRTAADGRTIHAARRPRHLRQPHHCAPSQAVRTVATASGLCGPRLETAPETAGAAHSQGRMELPVRIRVGKARRHGRPGARPRPRSHTDRGGAERAGMGSIREDAPARRR